LPFCLSCKYQNGSKKAILRTPSLLSALFWRDYNLQTINPGDVVGIGGRAANLESVELWCGVELTHPKMRVIGGARWNQTFENPLLPLNVKPIGGTDRFTEGWELVSWGGGIERLNEREVGWGAAERGISNLIS
jgi:hypothetical protein